jgi:hypothetical protein
MRLIAVAVAPNAMAIQELARLVSAIEESCQIGRFAQKKCTTNPSLSARDEELDRLTSTEEMLSERELKSPGLRRFRYSVLSFYIHGKCSQAKRGEKFEPLLMAYY